MASTVGVLVGRDAELRVLERALDLVEGGGSRAVGIVVEPGIGKSRLLGELGGRVAERGHVVVAGRAAELERDVPFAVWVDALDGHLAERGLAVLEGMAADEVADLAVALPAAGGRGAGSFSRAISTRISRASSSSIQSSAAASTRTTESRPM